MVVGSMTSGPDDLFTCFRERFKSITHRHPFCGIQSLCSVGDIHLSSPILSTWAMNVRTYCLGFASAVASITVFIQSRRANSYNE